MCASDARMAFLCQERGNNLDASPLAPVIFPRHWDCARRTCYHEEVGCDRLTSATTSTRAGVLNRHASSLPAQHEWTWGLVLVAVKHSQDLRGRNELCPGDGVHRLNPDSGVGSMDMGHVLEYQRTRQWTPE